MSHRYQNSGEPGEIQGDFSGEIVSEGSERGSAKLIAFEYAEDVASPRK